MITIGVNFLQILGGGLMAISFPLPSSPFSPPLVTPPLPLEIGPPNPARGSGRAL